jgi:hypothetical protein
MDQSSTSSASSMSSCKQSCTSDSESMLPTPVPAVPTAGRLSELVGHFTKYLEDFKLLSAREDNGRLYMEFRFEKYASELDGISTKSALVDGCRFSTETSDNKELHLTSIIIRDITGKNRDLPLIQIYGAIMHACGMSSHGSTLNWRGQHSVINPESASELKGIVGTQYVSKHSRYGKDTSRHVALILIAALILIKKLVDIRKGGKLDFVDCVLVKFLNKLSRGTPETIRFAKKFLTDKKFLAKFIKEANKQRQAPNITPLPSPEFDLPSYIPEDLRAAFVNLSKYKPEIAAVRYILAAIIRNFN